MIQWSGDVGLDMHISWALPAVGVKLQTIRTKLEEFCKPQSNVVCARFHPLTSFRQGNRSIDEWCNAVQACIQLCEYPTETAMILTRDIFWFSMLDTDFMAKTINNGNTDLEQYPAAKVWQMATKLVSSKATTNHIKQQTSNMHSGAQVNVLRHNCTNLPPKKKKDW